MAIEYEEGTNPLVDVILLGIMLYNKKFSGDQLKNFLMQLCKDKLYLLLENKNDINYFDFDIKIDKFGDCFEIKAKNIVSALWFIGEFPFDPPYIMETKTYLTNTGYYKFDGRTKKLNFYENT
jgi:hypothetical protein